MECCQQPARTREGTTLQFFANIVPVNPPCSVNYAREDGVSLLLLCIKSFAAVLTVVFPPRFLIETGKSSLAFNLPSASCKGHSLEYRGFGFVSLEKLRKAQVDSELMLT